MLAETILDESHVLTSDMQRFAIHVLGLEILDGLRHRCEVPDHVGTYLGRWEDRGENHAYAEACLTGPAQGLDSGLRRRNSRLDAPCEFAVHRRNRNLQTYLVCVFGQKVEVL